VFIYYELVWFPFSAPRAPSVCWPFLLNLESTWTTTF
jgi:hypothetical protein